MRQRKWLMMLIFLTVIAVCACEQMTSNTESGDDAEEPAAPVEPAGSAASEESSQVDYLVPSNGEPVLIRFNPDLEAASEWTVDKNIFGKFFESHGLDAHQGFVEYFLINGSFEVPYTDARPNKYFRNVPEHDNIPYPWQPIRRLVHQGKVEEDKVTFANLEGGIHGKESGPYYQQISVLDQGYYGGVRQSVVLPDKRTLSYKISFSVRGKAHNHEVSVRFEDDAGRILTEQLVPLTADWARHDIALTLPEASGARYSGNPAGASPNHGIYNLAFVVQGEAEIDLEWAVLQAADAAAGKFNPTTVENFKRFNITSIRWGGNHASYYNWKNGVGPLQNRPVTHLDKGGLQYHYLGTNEFLEFCQIVGAEPILNHAFNPALPPELAAEWVEYVNGSIDTPMGKLRAQHGYPEPWGVKYWMVGNEVYGPYQQGHTNENAYAVRVQEYIEAMKAVDPEIVVIAAGIDPLHTTYYNGKLPTWNHTVFEKAGHMIDGIDIHKYEKGINEGGNNAAINNLRKQWARTYETDGIGYNLAMVAAPSMFGQLMAELAEAAKERDAEPFFIDVGEWNLQPNVPPGWPAAANTNMAHAVYVSGMFNAFIRQGEHVKMAHHSDWPIYMEARPASFSPPGPSNHTFAMYAEPFKHSDALWHFLPADVEGPTFNIPKQSFRIRETLDVPYVDAASVISKSGDRVYHFINNRDLLEEHEVRLKMEGKQQAQQVHVMLQYADSPFTPHYDWENYFDFPGKTMTLEPDQDGVVQFVMPPASIARVEYQLK